MCVSGGPGCVSFFSLWQCEASHCSIEKPSFRAFVVLRSLMLQSFVMVDSSLNMALCFFHQKQLASTNTVLFLVSTTASDLRSRSLSWFPMLCLTFLFPGVHVMDHRTTMSPQIQKTSIFIFLFHHDRSKSIDVYCSLRTCARSGAILFSRC